MTHRMKIHDLRLQVRLGCTRAERAVPQEVRVGVELSFFQEPAGCVSDDLRDTICYARLSEILRDHVRDREFHLIEKMAHDFVGLLRAFTEGRAALEVRVHKVRPPVADLLGGVEYLMGDLA